MWIKADRGFVTQLLNKLNLIKPFLTNLTNKIWNVNCIKEAKTTELRT